MARKNNLLKQYKKQKIEMTDEEKAAHAAAVDQVIAHFAETYVPSGDTRLANLQQLCRDLEVEVGTSSMTCKMVSGCTGWLKDLTRFNRVIAEHQRLPCQHSRLHPRQRGERKREQHQVSVTQSAPR